jgi:hypothetical protein
VYFEPGANLVNPVDGIAEVYKGNIKGDFPLLDVYSCP